MGQHRAVSLMPDTDRVFGLPVPGERPILITGGSGFIGSHFCRTFDALGQRYVILDLHAPDASSRPVRFVRGDIRNRAAIERALEGCGAVLHLAAAHHDSGIDTETYYGVNRDATALLVQCMREHAVRSLCFYSSVAVYGSSPVSCTETTPTNPDSPYGASKLAAEAVVASAIHDGDLAALIIRPTVTFGPGNFANMYSLIEQIARRRYVHVGPSANRKSLSYVENIVDFTLWAWSRMREPLEVYNWVESPDLTSREIANHIASALAVRLPRVGIPVRLALLACLPLELASRMLGREATVSRMRIRKLAVSETVFSSEKARRLGFSPRVHLDVGIRNMVDWQRGLPRRERIRRIAPAEPVQDVEVHGP